MSSVYECLTCGDIFEHPVELDVSEPDEHFGTPCLRPMFTDACPECGGEDLEKVTLCITCDDAVALEGQDECGICAALPSREEKVQIVQILLRECRARLDHQPALRGRMVVLESILVDYQGEKRAGK